MEEMGLFKLNSPLNNFKAILPSLLMDSLQKRNKSKLPRNASVFTSKYLGPTLIGALFSRSSLYFRDDKLIDETEKCYDAIIQSLTHVIESPSEMPDEALYGRTGFLAALMMLREQGFSVPNTAIASVSTYLLVGSSAFLRNIFFVTIGCEQDTF